MKLTRLIDMLQRMETAHGDVDVELSWSHGSEPGPVGSVVYSGMGNVVMLKRGR